MVVATDSVNLGENHQIKLVFDQSSKSHLTTAKGAPNFNSYTSQARTSYGKYRSVDKKHQELDKGVHAIMKKTTYSIGEQGLDAPNEKTTTKELVHNIQVQQNEQPSKFDKNSRRADPSNPNRTLTVGFGYGAEKGTKDQ